MFTGCQNEETICASTIVLSYMHWHLNDTAHYAQLMMDHVIQADHNHPYAVCSDGLVGDHTHQYCCISYTQYWLVQACHLKPGARVHFFAVSQHQQ